MSQNKVKTILCKNYKNNGFCKFQNKCTFAHGKEELKIVKKDSPCWFFNNGGCKNSAEDCNYKHEVKVIRKPLHLQQPCKYYHLFTTGECKDKECVYDHTYELYKEEWEYHFLEYPYPGINYLKISLKSNSHFPILKEIKVIKPLLNNWNKKIKAVPRSEKKSWADMVEEEEETEKLKNNVKNLISLLESGELNTDLVQEEIQIIKVILNM